MGGIEYERIWKDSEGYYMKPCPWECMEHDGRSGNMINWLANDLRTFDQRHINEVDQVGAFWLHLPEALVMREPTKGMYEGCGCNEKTY